jgi:hypothetical protein
MTDILDRVRECHEDDLEDTYDQGYREGYAEAIRVARHVVKGRTYSRAVRGLLTRLHNDFKQLYS